MARGSTVRGPRAGRLGLRRDPPVPARHRQVRPTAGGGRIAGVVPDADAKIVEVTDGDVIGTSYARHVHDPGDLSWIGRHIKAVRSRSALGSTVKYIAADAIIFMCSDETMYSAR
jgi:hypothetical protein